VINLLELHWLIARMRTQVNGSRDPEIDKSSYSK